MDSFGFIITRHVNSETTNKYWNHSVKILRTLYPKRKIVIIDDNSNQNFVKADFTYNNVQIIQSEFPGRGELLPYYYFIKHKFFENAIIMHDSVFIHKRINFDNLRGKKVVPLWHFTSDNENIEKSIKITKVLLNSHILQDKLRDEIKIGLPQETWYGCFGVQAYINHNFLLHIENKYKITNLVQTVLNRPDRCCLERIMGCIFNNDCPLTIKIKSLFGDITQHHNWREYTFDKYIAHLKKGTIPHVVVKVWTGR